MAPGAPEGPAGAAYRLRMGVARREAEDRLQLVLPFPLKTVALHAAWKPALESLSGGGFVPLERILHLMGHPQARQVESLLNDLVRKGFLEQEGVASSPGHPFVSIIVPVRNRPLELEACLRSLGELAYPRGRFEVLVVDDASTDETPRVASRFPVRLIRLAENRQAPHCRNVAAREAAGGILAFLDSDCTASPAWLRELVPAFQDPAVGVVGGRVASPPGGGALDRYEAVKSSLIVGRRHRRSTEEDRFFYVPSCNLLVRRSAFLAAGGFKEALFVGEDVDLCWRMQDAGQVVEFRPAGTVVHRHRNRLRAFCARRFDYGTSEPLLQRLHPDRRKVMVFAPGAALFWGSVLSAVPAGWPPLFLSAPAVLGADALARWTRVRKRGLPVPLVTVLAAVARGAFAQLYHVCAFASRYGLIWTLPLFFLWPAVSAVLFGMHLFAGLVEFAVNGPRLDPLRFLFYFSMEQLSYQLGVWWGCFRNRSFSAVNPRLALQTAAHSRRQSPGGRRGVAVAVNGDPTAVGDRCAMRSAVCTRERARPAKESRESPATPLGLKAFLRLLGNGLRFRWLKWSGRPGRPQAVSLEVTHRCVARCMMCNIWKIPSSVKDLPLEAWLRLLSSDTLADLRELDITGGEPFLREDLLDLFRGIRERKGKNLPLLASVAVTTNGLLTGRVLEETERILKVLAPAGIELVMVCAMDAVGGLHDRIRGYPDAWSKVDATVQGLRSLRRAYPNLIIGLKTTILPLNVGELDKIVAYADANGLFTILSPCIITRGRYLNPDRATDLEFSATDREAMAAFFEERPLRWAYHSKALARYFRTGVMRKPCTCGFNYFFVRSTGDVYLCPLIDESVGNIAAHPLSELLASEKARRIRRRIGRRPECRQCTEPGLERYALPYEGWTCLSLACRMGPRAFQAFHHHLGLSKYR